ncbi:MAG: conserved repeat domain protein, partial [Herbinix sp.]|nr:conserved repeat domain protein [Herbinix sp.]
ASSATFLEDTPGSGTLSGSDTEGDTLTYHKATEAAHGTVTVNGDGSFIYLPEADYDGSDSFTFTVNDGTTDSTPATVTIDITPVNDKPVATAGTLDVTEDTLQNGTLSASDIDGDSLTFEAVTLPSKGTVVVNANGSYTYTPNADVTGSDSFTFRVKDGALYSDAATIMITITLVNDNPNAHDGILDVEEDVLKKGMLSGTDIDGDNLTFEAITQPMKGVVKVNPNGSYTYLPNANATGSDSFSFRTKDGSLYSEAATITINIIPVNDKPEAKDGELVVTEDSRQNGMLSATDIDGDSVFYEAISQPKKGIVTVHTNGTYTYLPNPNATGSDSFTYHAKDASLYSNAATITINITPVNDKPEASDGELSVMEDNPQSGLLTVTDIDGDDLTYELINKPTKGSITINSNGTYTYKPNDNAIGADGFTYQAKDAYLTSNTAKVTITINPVNDSPMAYDGVLVVTEDTKQSGTLLAYDVDGDDLTFEVVGQPSKGTISINPNGSYTFMPKLNATGNDSFTFRAKHGSYNTNIATIAIRIEPVNDIPVARSINVSLSANEEGSGKLSGYDIEGNNLTFSIVANALHGTVKVKADGSFTYKPDADYTGNDSFTFKVNDEAAASEPATVVITVTGVTIIISKDDREEDGNYVIPTDIIMNKISEEGGQNVSVSVQVPNAEQNDNHEKKQDLILKSEILEAAKEDEKSMAVTIKDEDKRELYTWTFDKDELSTSEKMINDVNLTIDVSAVTDETELEETIPNDNSKGLVLNFSHAGELPCQAQIRIYVGNQEGVEPGSSIYLYYYNRQTGKLEILPNSTSYTVDEDGYVTIKIVHCSDYVVFFEEISDEVLTNLLDQIGVTLENQTLYMDGMKSTGTNLRITLPSTLEKVDSFKDSSEDSAIAGVTVHHSSSNTKVVKVDKNGKVIAVGKGKAVISTTFTLFDGTKRVIKTSITVMKPYIVLEQSVSSMKVGDKFTFKVKVYGIENEDILWSTSKKSILSIDRKSGVATATSKGTDYVVIKVGNITKRIKVTVY